MCFTNPISKLEFLISAFIFVDDTNVGTADVKFKKTEGVIAAFQRAIHAWQGCLHEMGGELVPDKSFWYLFNHNPIPVDLSADCRFMMKNSQGITIPIRCLSIDEAEVTLGVAIASSGKNRLTIPGSNSIQSAYRSELGGLFSMIASVFVTCDLYNIRTGKVILPEMGGVRSQRLDSVAQSPRLQKIS